MLMVSEIAECMEGIRKGLNDSHLPQFKMRDVELADLFIRWADFVGHLGIDIDSIIATKRSYNATRSDHTVEERKKLHGKKF